MALVLQDQVRVRLTSVTLGLAASRGLVPQPPLYGRVTSAPGGGVVDVLWDNGTQVLAVPEASLDQLNQPTDADRDAFTNRLVRPLVAGKNVASAEYDSEVMSVLAVNPGASLFPPAPGRLICRTLRSGAWFDIAPANVKALNNR